MAITYTALVQRGEFRALFLSQSCTVAAGTMSGIALGTLVNAATGSALLTALSMFGSTFANLFGAMTLMSHADTAHPRRRLLALQVTAVTLLGLQALPAPLWVRFTLLLSSGLAASVSSGIRLGLLSEVVPGPAYAAARSLMNIATGTMQILGFGCGAVLLTWLAPAQIFLTAAGIALLGAVILRLGIGQHSIRITSRPGIRQTVRVNNWLIRQRHHRVLITRCGYPTVSSSAARRSTSLTPVTEPESCSSAPRSAC